MNRYLWERLLTSLPPPMYSINTPTTLLYTDITDLLLSAFGESAQAGTGLGFDVRVLHAMDKHFFGDIC
jgi:hypothetical protein